MLQSFRKLMSQPLAKRKPCGTILRNCLVWIPTLPAHSLLFTVDTSLKPLSPSTTPVALFAFSPTSKPVACSSEELYDGPEPPPLPSCNWCTIPTTCILLKMKAHCNPSSASISTAKVRTSFSASNAWCVVAPCAPPAWPPNEVKWPLI